MFQDVEDVFTTEDPRIFLEKLNGVRIRGGGDCPEMSLSGLEAGIQNALPNSLVYVITDATAKDYDKYKEVNSKVQAKQHSVSEKLTIKLKK